ncbi:MAG: aspartyl protease family protein [candidate division NC10 bacterium]
MRRFRLLLILLALLAGPVAAPAQMVRWIDDQGRVHYSEGLDSVPERYRATAKPLALPTSPPAPEARQPGPPPPGVTKIPFKPGSPILVSAKINGGGPVTLMLDTGADTTVVNPLALWRLGISTWFAPRAEIRGATGTTSVDIVRVQSIEVGEAKAGPLVIVAHDIDFKNADGLLGRDFLNHFNVNIDSAAGIVTLSPR